VRVAAAIASLIAVAAAASIAAAGPVAAVVADDDARRATLIGPSGQVWLGDGAGAWIRRKAGGVSADVAGATRIGDAIVVSGTETPMFRFDGERWTALRLGQSGKTILGRGPIGAVAIGRHVFVHHQNKWVRVGMAPPNPIAVWASSPKRVFVVTAAGTHSLRGVNFVRTTNRVDAIVGSAPWGVTDSGLVDLSRGGRMVVPARDIVAAAGSGTTAWAVAGAAGGKQQLIGVVGGKPKTIETPIAGGTAIAGIAADAGGRVVIATTAGDVHLWSGEAWTTGKVTDELPAARPGSGPARTK
jgi:hypothetical protein